MTKSEKVIHDEFQKLARGWLAPHPGKSGSLGVAGGAKVLVFGKASAVGKALGQLKGEIPEWQVSELTGKKVSLQTSGAAGPIWVLRPFLSEDNLTGTGGRLTPSPYSQMRECVGLAMVQVLDAGVKHCQIELEGLNAEQLHGALVAIEIAAYRYKSVVNSEYPPALQLTVRCDGNAVREQDIRAAQNLAGAVNLARHLVNSPPNVIQPQSYAAIVEHLFAKVPHVEVEIWQQERLKKENMNLMLAVGSGGPFAPCLVQIRYRPKGAKGKGPIAFVGKGITFDSGGLNLKPDSGMRLMKKDMGGSASVLGLAWWVAQSQYREPCDFYLALAENSVDAKSFRPSDVVCSRQGLTVEIHNTDAEGRLVLADALNVAVSKKPAPRMVIDVATLTGAIKAGLGSAVAGLFGNDDKMVVQLERASQKMGDWLWPMPLFRKYKSALKSNFADLANSSDGFGGAVTAALFLEAFVADVPWAHLDIYAWKDSSEGPIAEAGANGQAIQALSQFLTTIENH